MSQLAEHHTWAIQDSSKIQNYMTCPRKYFFEHVLGWRYENPNVHLEFGTAFHLAMETLLSEGYSAESVARAYSKFLAHYRQFFDESMDQATSPKNPGCALRALSMYIQQYPRDLDEFQVLHVEVSGSVPINSDRVIYFKTDTLCEGAEGFFSLEHKTGSRFSTSWAAQWRLKFQVGTYLHVLYSLYPPNDVYGVKINGIFPHEEPKMKRDGTPYAGSNDTEFHRVIVRRNLRSMQSWLTEANHWVDQINHDFDLLSETREEDEVLSAFPRCSESCTQYGVCPFLDYCSIWDNPLQHADSPPVNFKIHHWDPRSPEYVKETMEIK
jgi:hypothetical protein